MRAVLPLLAVLLATPGFAQSDSCSTATPLNGEGAFPLSLGGATNTAQSPSCSFKLFNSTPDLWIEWTPTISGNYFLDVTSPDGLIELAVLDGCAGVELGCATFGRLYLGNLVAGTAYIIQTELVQTSGGDLMITHLPVPTNDDCGGAQSLGMAPISVSLQTFSASADLPTNCSDGNATVWYRWMTGSATAYNFEVTGGNFNAILSVFDACGGTEFACSELTGVIPSYLAATGLSPNSEYWLRIDSAGPAGGTGQLEIREAVANDQCSSAAVLSGPGPHTVSNIDAGDEGFVGSSGRFCGTGRDVWYSWTAPSTEAFNFRLCPANFNVVMSVFSACGGSELDCGFSALACGTASLQSAEVADIGAFGGNEYLIRVEGFNPVEEGTGTLEIFPTPAAPNAVGMTFCTSTPNSTQEVADLRASRVTSISTGPLRLTTVDLPPGAFGLHYFGVFAVNIPFGDGTRCVGGLTQRLPVQSVGTFGQMTTPNVFNLASGSPLLSPGDLYFQCWYRDQAAQGAGFNLSNAEVVTLTP